MKIISPAPNDIFTVDSAPTWPSISFQTDATGPHHWTWKIVWKTYTQSGTADTADNQWDAQSAVTNFGGTLTVTAKAGDATASVAIILKGTNPNAAAALAFVASWTNSAGFDKILEKESGFRNFNAASGEPIKSFDNGYGMCQLTTPPPSFAQIWNWKQNIQAGLLLFMAKRLAAVTYLSQSGRTATDDQIKHEAVCRWNGGHYHTWDEKTAAWVRNPAMLCDPAAGNIGWDMTDPENAGKSLPDLHKRDSKSFNHPPAPGAQWKYSGICYADRLLS